LYLELPIGPLHQRPDFFYDVGRASISGLDAEKRNRQRYGKLRESNAM